MGTPAREWTRPNRLQSARSACIAKTIIPETRVERRPVLERRLDVDRSTSRLIDFNNLVNTLEASNQTNIVAIQVLC